MFSVLFALLVSQDVVRNQLRVDSSTCRDVKLSINNKLGSLVYSELDSLINNMWDTLINNIGTHLCLKSFLILIQKAFQLLQMVASSILFKEHFCIFVLRKSLLRGLCQQNAYLPAAESEEQMLCVLNMG